ncbi:MAG: L,D-transpeptidase family protein [Mailhella sp.]|nr:L,D-transpeptidase family protein [Mailhella sp.]
MRAYILALFAILAASPAFADWTACLPANAPDHFFAVDKGKDRLFQMRGDGITSAVVKAFPSIHGRAEGDKQVQGDLKTPEGVYFITHKINQKLDFMDYGPHAFGLNYPNPMDRLRAKTGGGIWLHSKGQPIKGIQTRGCVAIGQEDITALVPVLAPGTPVLIAQNLDGEPFIQKEEKQPGAKGQGVEAQQADASGTKAAQPDARQEEAFLILSLTKTWIEHMHDGSEAVFALYDSSRWQKANRESFFDFMAKKRVDLAHGAGDMQADSIRLLEGPGYWVAFFPRSFVQGKDSFNGTQILYWSRGDAGSFRIIGEFRTKG